MVGIKQALFASFETSNSHATNNGHNKIKWVVGMRTGLISGGYIC